MRQKNTFISLLLICLDICVFNSNAIAKINYFGNTCESFVELLSPSIDSTTLFSREKSIAVAQMNQCVESLSRIIESQSRLVLINELDALLNQLDTEHADYIVIDFRKRLCSALTTLIINEEDKFRIQRIAEEELDEAVMQSISDALGQPWITTNGVSAVITTAKIAAQSVINYNLSVKKIQRIADKNLWTIEKNSLKILGEMRTEAIGFTHNMMKNYGLKECYKITEYEATLLSEALSKDDLVLRLYSLQNLLSQRSYQESIGYYAPYWYFLGDTFIKLGRYQEGFDAYEKYLKMNAKAPIFRKNTYEGLINLDILQHKKELSDREKETLLKSIEYNLSDNGPAIIIAALNYYSLNKNRKATELLTSSLGLKSITCKDEIVRTLANYYKSYCSSQDLKNLVITAINDTHNLCLSTILDFYYAIKDDPEGRQKLGIDKISVNTTNYLKTIANVYVKYPAHINGNLDSVNIFVENRESTFSKREKGKKYYVYQDLLRGPQWIEKKEIINKFTYFKDNENDIEYLFRKINNDWYMFREDLNLSSVSSGDGLPEKIYEGLKIEEKGQVNLIKYKELQDLWNEKRQKNQQEFSTDIIHSLDDFPYGCKMLLNSPADYEIAIAVKSNKNSPTYVLKYWGKWGQKKCDLVDIFKYM